VIVRRHPRTTTVALAIALVLTLAACSGGGKKEAAKPSSTTTTASPTTTVAPLLAPLTGLPATDAALLARPALIVKVDNVEPKARPQAGLNQADVVYEERVEGSVTRLLAIFHSTDAAPVGPVRSARTSDIGVFSPLHRPFYAWSGANDVFAARVRAANITDVGVDRAKDQYYRAGGFRHAPDNLMLRSTAEIMSRTAPGATAPPPLFTYRAADQAPAHLEPITGVTISYGTSAGAAPVTYSWNGTGWARSQKGTPHVDEAGVQVAPANVVIQFVDYAPTDVVDQFGKAIPEAQLVGEGDAWVLTAGGLVPGRWHKASLEAVTTYTDVDGHPIALTPGRTWVALPSPGGAVKR
jgi:hypothetical protein